MVWKISHQFTHEENEDCFVMLHRNCQGFLERENREQKAMPGV